MEVVYSLDRFGGSMLLQGGGQRAKVSFLAEP